MPAHVLTLCKHCACLGGFEGLRVLRHRVVPGSFACIFLISLGLELLLVYFVCRCISFCRIFGIFSSFLSEIRASLLV